MADTPAPPETVLEVRDLHKTYGSVDALRGLTFSVPRGAFYGFFGRNGAGKTTTLDIVTGLLNRDRGNVRLLGEDLGMEPSPEVKTRFAYVGGHITLYGWMSLQEHLDFVSGFYPTWDAEHCLDLQRMFRLSMDQRADSLSPGQHVQFQLLMALSRHPELLIVDEPGNLDPVVRTRLMDAMVEILETEDATIMMASHLIDELEGICDHMCVIDHGVAIAGGPVEMLIEDVREVHFRGVSDQIQIGPTPILPDGRALEGIWHQRYSGRELRLVMAAYTDEKADGLARMLHAESYEISRLGLQDFFVALTADRD
jgi:ABC-2 type transport system ATP-binding protein